MYWIRTCASLYALVTFLNLAGQWRYANVAVEHGGARLNPFNDPRLVPCVYPDKNRLAPIAVECSSESKHGQRQWAWIAYMCLHALALACFAHEKWFGGDRGGQGSLQNGVVLGVCVLVAGYALKPKSPI